MGLLDTFFGNADQTQALGLLGANMMAGNTAQGFAQMQGLLAQAPVKKRQAEMDALKMGLLQAQVSETQAQGDERRAKLAQMQRQQDFDAQFTGGGGAAGGSPQGGPGAGGLSAQQISQQYGIPLDQVIADYKFNNGKKIAEFMEARSKPNWQNINGNLVNTNAQGFQGGLQGGVSAGSNGQVTAWQPDGRGGLVVGAPPGAMDTFSEYQRRSAGVAADNELVTVPLPGGSRLMTRAQAQRLTGGQEQPTRSPNPSEVGMRQQVAGPMGADPAAIQREIKAAVSDLTTKPLDPASRQALEAHVQDLTKTLKTIGPSGPGVQLKKSPTKGQETLDTEFAKEHAIFSAAGGYADVEKQLIQLEEAASKLKPGSGMTGPMVGLIPDKLRTLTNPGAVDTMEQVLETAQRNLRVVLGPQFTAKEGEALLGRVYNPMLPPEVNQKRVQALITQIRKGAEAKADAGRYFDQNGTLDGWSGKLPTFADFDQISRGESGKTTKPPIPMKGMVRGGYRYKGGDPASPSSWEKM